MPFGWVTAGAAVVGTAASLAKGSGQSGAISDGQAQANAVLAPYSSTGVKSDTATADLLGLNGKDAATTAMGNFTASPGYQYSVDQGLKAVDAGAASKGMLRSGATLKAEQTLGSNLADQDFGAYIGRLNSLSNYGITAAGGQASTDTGAAANQASIYGNTANSLSNTATGLLGNSNVQNGLNSFFSPSTSYTGGGTVGTQGGTTGGAIGPGGMTGSA